MGVVNRVMIGTGGTVDLHVTSTTQAIKRGSSGEGGKVQVKQCLTNGWIPVSPP